MKTKPTDNKMLEIKTETPTNVSREEKNEYFCGNKRKHVMLFFFVLKSPNGSKSVRC